MARSLNTTLRNSLLKEDAFAYAHLVKFERPKPLKGTSTAGKDYLYLTDGSHDIIFDDGSGNGAQTYIANKVKKVGSVAETTQARATSVSLNISSAALSTAISATRLIVSGSSITSDTDLVEVGFREGDIIQLLTSSGSNNTVRVRINAFSNSNFTAAVTPLDKVVSGEIQDVTSLSSEGSSPIASNGVLYSLNFAGPEIEGVILSSTSSRFAKFINRDVFIYKAHLNPDTGAIIGNAYLLFKGIVESGKVQESPEKESTVSWGITSHWGDFSRVNGRITSDSFHRALGTDGQPDVDALIRTEYAGDFGFQHSEQSINLVATYNTKERRTRIKESGGWFFGLNKSYSQQEYFVDVERETDLAFNLNARSLPVVYGVNKIDSIPVFVDTAATSSSRVFVAYALCEGPISAILDIYQDDMSTICVNSQDLSGRGEGATGIIPEAVDIPCVGRMDAGSTLRGFDALNTSATPTLFGSHTNSFGQGSFATGAGELNVHTELNAFPLRSNFGAAFNSASPNSFTGIGAVTGDLSGTNSSGIAVSTIFHEKGMHFETPIDFKFIFHSGKPDQRADSLLLFNAANMKLGNDYHSGKTTEYWGAGHRLLDTAYIAGEFNISEGETTIPSLDFVVRGKGVECFNYDYTYFPDPAYTPDQYLRYGDFRSVEVRATSDDSLLDTVDRVEVYPLTSIDGVQQYVVRFLEKPNLGDVKNFYIQRASGTAYKYYLQTHDALQATGGSGTIPAGASVSSTTLSNAQANTDNPPRGVDITMSTSSANAEVKAALALGANFALASSLQDFPSLLHTFSEYDYVAGSNTVTRVGLTTEGRGFLVGKRIVVKNAIPLATSATSSVVGKKIILTVVSLVDGSTREMVRTITAFDNTTKVALVDTNWDIQYLPLPNSSYQIFADVNGDVRVTTNPAMQLLDYLTNERYGRGLDVANDIDLESFLSAARACDTRSDVTVLMDTNYGSSGISDYSVMVGAIYGEPDLSTDGTNWTDENPEPISSFTGKVKSVTPINIGGNTTRYYKVVFTDCIHKLSHRYHNWKGYRQNMLYYDASGNLGAVAVNASLDADPFSAPTPAPTSVTTNPFLRLAKLSGNGPAYMGVDTDKSRITFEGNPVVKDISVDSSGAITGISNGYSLYDSDDVKYWRYCGWEEQQQRWATRHQTNHVVNTATSVFNNINGMLGHFNGILRYSNGKYALSVGAAAATNEFASITVDGESYVIQDITEEDIVGSISVSDPGAKGTYNAVSVSLVDPQNKFENRSITMLNSDYLKEDKRIPKRGDVRGPGITNFFNARMNAKQYLDQARKALKINFTMGPRGVLLHSGDLIRITYPRFAFSNKTFRISNLSIEENCLIKITAEEHEDNTYLIQSDLPISIVQDDPSVANFPTPAAPTDSPTLSATQNERGGIDLNWTNTSTFNSAIYTVQIWRNTSNQRSTAVLQGISKGSTFTDVITGTGSQTFYYWIRYSVLQTTQRTDGVVPKELFSPFFPSSATGGIEGVSDGARDAVSINLTNDNVSVPADSAGTPASFNNTDVTITAFIGSTAINYDDSAPYASPSFRVSNSNVSAGITAGAEGSTSTSYTRQTISAMSADTGSIEYTIIVTDSLGQTTTFGRTQTFTKVRDGLVGSNGESGRTVSLSTDDQTIEYNTAGTSPSPSSVTVTATAFNTSGTVFYEFLKENSTVQNTTSNTYTYTPQASVSNMPETVSVKIREGSNSGSVTATDQINIMGLRQGRDAIVIVLSNEAHTVTADNNGTVSSFAFSGTDIQVYQGTNQLTYDASSPYANSTFRVSASGSNISPGSASTVSGNTRRFGNASNMTADSASITFTIVVKGSDGAESTFTRVQSFSKSRSGASVTGATGPRTASAVLYYQTSSTSAPSAPTASNYNFSTGEFGSHTSGWDEDAPTFAAGNTNKYWYVRISVAEATFGGTQNISVGNVIQGIGFSGLVTFTGNQAVGDGNQSLSFGAQGTTTIDGGRITTGTIDAQRLNVGQINVTQTANYSTIQQNITGAAQQGITAAQQAAGQAVQAQQGVTAAQQAAQSAAGQAVQAQQGVVVAQQAAAAAVQTIPDQLSDLQNNIGAFTQPGQINVTQTNNYSAPPTNTNQLTNGAGFQTQAFTSPGQVNITQTQNYVAPPTNTNQLTNGAGFYNQPGQLNITQLTNYGNVTQAIAQAAAQGVAGQQAASAAAQQATQAQQGVSTAQTAASQASAQAVTAQQSIPTQTSQLSNNSGFQTAAITFSATAISGGKIGLSTQGLIFGNGQVSVSTNNAILLDTTQGNNAISIYSGNSLRVKIGKL